MAAVAAVVAAAAVRRHAASRSSDIVPLAPAPVPERPVTAVGLVTESGTGRLLQGVMLWVDSGLVWGTDSAGVFTLTDDDWGPGTHEVIAEQRGYLTTRVELAAHPGRVDTIRIDLPPAPRPCCRPDGRWSIELYLDSAGGFEELRQRPTRRQIRGIVFFSDALPSPFERRWSDPAVLVTPGRFDVDFSPFFGGRIARDVSTTIFGPMNASFYREAEASVFHGDSIEVVFIPRISHGGVTLSGRIEGDSVTGRWQQNAYCCGAYGRFVMRRRGGGLRGAVSAAIRRYVPVR